MLLLLEVVKDITRTHSEWLQYKCPDELDIITNYNDICGYLCQCHTDHIWLLVSTTDFCLFDRYSLKIHT